MNTQRSLRTHAARRNTLAACLAIALAAGGVGAADIAHFPATPRMAGAKASPPMRPAGNNLPVTNCLDDGSAGSLRQVIAGAIDGDVIDLSALTCSTITLQSGAIGVPASVSIGGPGQTELTIDGGGTDRVFQSKYDMAISDITITNGRVAGDGGCVDVVGGNLTLTRTTFTGCHAGHVNATQSRGGGVYVGGNLLMEASTISGSSATATSMAYGGGAYIVGLAQLDVSRIESNSVTTATAGYANGGGLFAKGGSYIVDSRIVGNEASANEGSAFGGGVYAVGGVSVVRSAINANSAHSEAELGYGGGTHVYGNLDLTATVLSGNTASANCIDCFIMGGGASAFGEIIANNSTISDNQIVLDLASGGEAAGGGLATWKAGEGGKITLSNSTISGNAAIGGASAVAYGGGIAAADISPFVARNSTIALNTASTFGGGAVGSGTANYAPVLNSSIVANNEAPSGADLGTAPSDPLVIEGSNNIVMDASGNITLPNDTIGSDPQLLPLNVGNGGSTATHALAPGSIAIDAGSNVINVVYDQRGCPYVRESNSVADIGAFEFQVETPDHVFAHGFDGTIANCL